MFDKIKKDRRRFLTATAGVLSALMLPAIYMRRSQTTAPENVSEKLVRTLNDQEAAAIIGRDYLKLYPEEAKVDLLVKKILPSDLRENWRITETEHLSEEIDNQIKTDFDRGEVVPLEGWILARTELRLFALAALLS